MEPMVSATLRGVERYHIVNYLINCGYLEFLDGEYRFEGIRVQVSPQRMAVLGALKLAELDIRFVAGGAAAEIEMARLKRHFLTAGG